MLVLSELLLGTLSGFLCRREVDGNFKYQFYNTSNYHPDNGQFICEFDTEDLTSDPPYIIQSGISMLEQPTGFQVDITSIPALKYTPNFPYKHHVLGQSWQLTLENKS